MSPAATIGDDEATRAILRAADDLFYARGIAAVTMSDVRDRSGVSMRRLYALHPSKSDLVAAWLTERHRTWMNWFTVTVDRHIATGTDSLLATFDALAEWIASPGYRGCAFVNAIADFCRRQRERVSVALALSERAETATGVTHIGEVEIPVHDVRNGIAYDICSDLIGDSGQLNKCLTVRRHEGDCSIFVALLGQRSGIVLRQAQSR